MKCRYETPVSGRCLGSKEIDPCPGYDKCEGFKPDYKTNGDHIRALTDKEMAEILADFDGDYFCRNMKECEDDLDADKIIPVERCRECALLWLKSEYKPKEAE